MDTQTTGNPTSKSSGISLKAVWEDLVSLTKARLSVLVVITAVFGYLVATKVTGSFTFLGLINTTFGTLLAALGSAVFNQVMEADADAQMTRTEDRPLPAKRIPTAAAFVLGFLLSAFGVVHLSMTTNFAAGAFAAATLFTYLFVYTPLKRVSTSNTIVGAVSGALPPLIGWAAGGGALWGMGALTLFALLFFWQLPHFAAINWMYREEYMKGGFVMWSNQDESGQKTARLALLFSICLSAVGLLAGFANVAAWWAAIGMVLLGGYMCFLAYKFLQSSDRKDARKLFFFTLMYLPLVMIIGYLGWKTAV